MARNRIRTALAAVAAAIAGTIAVPTAATAQGSGFVDIVAWHFDGELWAWSNINGFNQPTFPYTPWRFGQGWAYPNMVKFGDLDGDTYDDLIAVRDGNVVVYRNVNGLFPGNGVTVGQGWFNPERAYFADIDGDGRDEIINLDDDGNIWSWHNSRGIDPNTYAVNRIQIGRGWSDVSPYNIYFADLNGDGRDELIKLDNNNELWAWHNINGGYTAGNYRIGTGWDHEYPFVVHFADINNDGRSDLISVNGDVRAWRNVNGNFTVGSVTIATGFTDTDTFFAEILP